jgi:uncharacterized membrane protein
MRHFSLNGLFFLCFGVAAYAVAVYGFGQPRAHFEAHALGIRAHVFAAVLAVLFGPFQFSSTLRVRWPRIHRWMGRIYLAIGVGIGGLAALYMSYFAWGGITAKLGFACLGTAWLVTGAKAYLCARARDFAGHRRWMIRNFSLTCAAVTLRVYLPLSLSLGVAFELAYPVIAWICWVPNVLIAEWILASTSNPSTRDLSKTIESANSEA